jgi:tetratricopeptide (TPR) repeat protein
MEPEQAPQRFQPRVIRVFVSSTFRDMQEERELLVKHIFPRLRKICEDRGVTWGEVDLRWGIPDEKKAEGKVLPVCLAEIHRCRPYFIGLLGERYGWVPDEIPQELIEQEPWLAEHLERSVTELEILHGVLRNPQMAGHALFYFRDPAYVDSLPVGLQSEFREGAGAEKQRQKLAALKQRIRESGLPLRENYHDPKELGELVFQEMKAVIDRLYPPGEKLDPLDREAAEHEAFARSRASVEVRPGVYSGVYIGRQEYFDALESHVESGSPPLVVLGESGSGKSALLANWALKYRESHRDELMIMHFIGGSPYSSDWAAMVRRIMGEFKRRFGIEQEIPDKPDLLRAAFANWLSMAAARGRVVLILDALNQLEDRDQAPDLVWLPPVIPETVRLILSTLPGRPLDGLKKRDWPVLKVEPLRPDERKELIASYLAQYTKELSPGRVERIASAEQAANPLFLRALLEELRVFGIYEKLEERIGHYLEARSIPELYEKILARYEEDYEGERPGLVGDAMKLLWAARRGLSEAELLELLGTDEEPLPAAVWSPLRLAAEQSLVSRSGLIGFFHDYIRQAAGHRYLPTDLQQNSAHIRLADYFGEKELCPRKIDELPWQLAKAKEWRRLNHLLADLPFFAAAWQANQFEVKAYWAQIEGDSQFRMVDAYRPMVEAPDQHTAYVWEIGMLFADTGHLEEALSLRGYLVEHYRQTGDRANLGASLGNQALILSDRGDLDGAMALHKEEERLCRELGNKAGLSGCLCNQAVILYSRGDLDSAMALYKEQERLCRELGNKDGLSKSLGNQALILYARGDLDGAMALHKEKERLCRELGNKAGLSISYGNQALILKDLGDLDGAMALYKEQERLCRERGNKDGLSKSLSGQALILKARGDLDGAMALHKEEERLCRQLGNKSGLQACFGNQANILYSRGDLDGAMALYKEQERLCRELGDKAVMATCFGNQANILYARGDHDGAMALYKEQERLCRELGNKDGLSISLGNQALIMRARGDLDGAMALYKEQERLCRELGNKAGLSISLGNQANILYARGDLDGAMALHKEEERLCHELGNKVGLQRTYGNQAVIVRARGDLEGAMALHKEEERLCRELGNPEGLARSFANQALLLAEGMGSPLEALPLVEQAYRLATDHGLTALARQIKPILDMVRSKLH